MEKYGISMARSSTLEPTQNASDAILQAARQVMPDTQQAWPASGRDGMLRAIKEICSANDLSWNPKVFVCDSKTANMVVQDDVVVASRAQLDALGYDGLKNAIERELSYLLIAKQFMPDTKRVRPASESGVEGRNLIKAVTDVCNARGVPIPTILVGDSTSANLVVSQQSNVLIASEGQLHKLEYKELKSVVGHEISHLVPDGALTRAAQRTRIVAKAFQKGPSSGFTSLGRLLKDLVGGFIAHVFAWVPGVLKKHKSRVGERAADREAVLHGEDAQALTWGLRKLNAANKPLSQTSNKVLMAAKILGNIITKPLIAPWQDHPGDRERERRIQEAAAAVKAPKPSMQR